MKSYKIVCKTKLEDVQLETLRDNQVNVFSFSLPVGIEGAMDTECEVYEVDKNGDVERKTKIGYIKTRNMLDEGMMQTEVEVSDKVMGLVKRFIF